MIFVKTYVSDERFHHCVVTKTASLKVWRPKIYFVTEGFGQRLSPALKNFATFRKRPSVTKF